MTDKQKPMIAEDLQKETKYELSLLRLLLADLDGTPLDERNPHDHIQDREALARIIDKIERTSAAQKPVIAEDLREEYEWYKAHSFTATTELMERASKAEAERDAAKRGWDSCIADLREAANICRGIEIERDEAKKRIAELEQQIARLKAPVSDTQTVTMNLATPAYRERDIRSSGQ